MLHRGWTKIFISWVMLGSLAIMACCLASCSGGSYNYECTVDRVEGVFVTSYLRTRTQSRMIVMHRFTDGKKRTFIFPAERVSCIKI